MATSCVSGKKDAKFGSKDRLKSGARQACRKVPRSISHSFGEWKTFRSLRGAIGGN